ncbi:hypothetical protein [Curtanaerobium respiraculi]|uniref:hypothetical protein n=1 Tax=Curtanaerobium respiraculi TaxID=2949669 RepID=UPI0024B333D0|nr:hypothetical protein [Curtanaerobium respiraculi]
MDAQATASYASAREYVLAAYADSISGSRDGLFCVLCEADFPEQAREALDKTAAALGYGDNGVTFVARASSTPLDTDDLFAIIEGLDPLCVIAADAGSAKCLERAYRTTLPLMAPCRAGGRTVRAFADFESLMKTPGLKQQAWAQLKTLPRLNALRSKG